MTKCYYHIADLDGHCSGAVVKHFEPEAELIGFNYGYDFPWDNIDSSDVVYMVDVSLPMDDMVMLAKALHQGGGQLIWIDHHIGVIRQFHELDPGVQAIFGGKLDDSKAACELCWEFFSAEPIPVGVQMLGIYDSWRFAPGAEEKMIKRFQYGMRLNPETRPEKAMPLWQSILLNGEESEILQQAMQAGGVIYSYQQTQNEKTCRSCAFETLLAHAYDDHALEPLRCIAVNSSLMNSDVYKSVYDPEKHDAMLCFYRSNRGFWRISIYSDKDEVDCSEYAKSYGGGGHKGAAGFQSSEDVPPFRMGIAEKHQ